MTETYHRDVCYSVITVITLRKCCVSRVTEQNEAKIESGVLKLSDLSYFLQVRNNVLSFTVTSPDTSVSVFSWQVNTYGQGKPSTYLGVFDINRWYSAQMPDSLR